MFALHFITTAPSETNLRKLGEGHS